MNPAELWSHYRRVLWLDPELGIGVDVSRMELDEEFLSGLRPGMEAAFRSMRALEEGAIANPDEGRMVGHYWLRAPETAPDPAIGREIRETADRIRSFAARVHSGEVRPSRAQRFTRLLSIGIGGSALGPEFVSQALGGPGDRLQAHFVDNTDPDGIDRTLAAIGDDLPRTLTVVISKSGGTRETRNGMLEVEAAYRRLGLALGAHALAVTGEGSALEEVARRESFLEVFPMWDWIGGRTSETSAVGLVPAALQGLAVDELLDGAREMDARTRVWRFEENPAALLAAAWYKAGNGRGERDMVVLPYKDRLLLFSRYLQQLVMESLGKEKDRDGNPVHQGIVVYGNKGSTDQHAYVQQLRDGPDNFFATFIHVARDRDGASLEVEEDATAGDYLMGFLLGTRRALYEKGKQSITITLPEVSARSIGMLIALYERAVGFYADLVHVNAYNQPGVEAGKKAAGRVLEIQRGALNALRAEPGRVWSAEDLARRVGAPDDAETVYHVMEHAAANPDHGVVRSGGPRPEQARYRKG